MFYVTISPSQQIHNACKYGDSEADHCRKIANEVFKNLDQDQHIKAYVIPKLNSSLQAGNKYLKEVVKLSDNFTKVVDRNKRYHIDIHTDAYKGETRGTTTFYYSRGSNSHKLAKCIHEQVVKLSGKSRSITARPKLAIMDVKASSILVELDFHDNVGGAAFIHANIKKLADAITIGLYKYLDIDMPKLRHYSLQVGYFSNMQNAEEAQIDLKKKGIDSIIKVI